MVTKLLPVLVFPEREITLASGELINFIEIKREVISLTYFRLLVDF